MAVGIENYSSIVAMIGGGLFTGLLMGYALKKIAKLVAILFGLFLTGIAYLQYQQILNINWDKLHGASQSIKSTLTNTITQIPGLNNTSDHAGISGITNFDISLTGCVDRLYYWIYEGLRKMRFRDLLSKLISISSESFFEEIIGYDHIKRLFGMALDYDYDSAIHILLVSPPAPAKTMFLTSLMQLKNSYFSDGANSTKAGMIDYVLEKRPRYLLIVDRV
jgi:uncharacterized membrane protein (Fun14 family)